MKRSRLQLFIICIARMMDKLADIDVAILVFLSFFSSFTQIAAPITGLSETRAATHLQPSFMSPRRSINKVEISLEGNLQSQNSSCLANYDAG